MIRWLTGESDGLNLNAASSAVEFSLHALKFIAPQEAGRSRDWLTDRLTCNCSGSKTDATERSPRRLHQSPNSSLRARRPTSLLEGPVTIIPASEPQSWPFCSARPTRVSREPVRIDGLPGSPASSRGAVSAERSSCAGEGKRSSRWAAAKNSLGCGSELSLRAPAQSTSLLFVDFLAYRFFCVAWILNATLQQKKGWGRPQEGKWGWRLH